MIPDDMLPHTGQRLRPTVAVDAHGSDAYTYPGTGPEVRGWAQQRNTTEMRGGRETVVTQWWWFCNDSDWLPRDRVRWDGGTFEVDGHPKPVYGPEGLHHMEVPLRRVTG